MNSIKTESTCQRYLFTASGLLSDDLDLGLITVTVCCMVLLFFITHSLFHSRLKTFFCKSFSLQPFFSFFQNELRDSPDFYCHFLHICFLLFSFPVLQFLVVVSVR